MLAKLNLLLVSVGTLGDTLPFVGLGRELLGRGHRVTFLGSGGYQELVERHGLEFCPLISPEEQRRETEQRLRWGNPWIAAREGAANLVRDIPTTYRAIADRYVPGRTIVVSTGLMFGARIAQEKLGVPLATVHLQPACFRVERDPLRWSNWVPHWWIRASDWISDGIVDHTLGRSLNDFRATLGLTPTRGVLRDWWHSPQLTIGAFPEFLSPARDRWPAEVMFPGFPAFQGAGDLGDEERLADFISRHPRPLVFSPTSAVRNVGAFMQTAANVATHLQRPAILLTPHVEFVPSDLPAQIAHFSFLPHERVFPLASAVIHNGGIGTVAACITAGVPQLIVPCILDQFDNAKRVRQLGVAEVLSQRQFQPTACLQAFDKLLGSPMTTRRCGELATLCRGQSTLSTMADAIERLHPANSR